MRRPTARLCALCLAAAALALLPLAAQELPRVEHLAGPGAPSWLLQEHLGKHREEFVFFDVAVLVHALAGRDLGSYWNRAEGCRYRGLVELLDSLREQKEPDRGGLACRGIAAIAAALLTGEPADVEALPSPLRTEASAVLDGRTGKLALLPEPVEHDWTDAVPSGAYVLPAGYSQQAEGLFRTTVYLRTYLHCMPDDLRARLMVVAHELATETPDDPLLQALGRDRWRSKWLEEANYTYLALRETDPLTYVIDSPPEATRPRLLVEPLPRTLAALREAAAASERVRKTFSDPGTEPQQGMVQLVEDLQAILAAQQAGADPDAERLDRSWQALQRWFVAEDPREGAIASLEGIEGGIRREGVFLVRVPIRWQGQDKTALAFRLYAMHQEPDGTWQLPPWGPELRPMPTTPPGNPQRK